MSPACVQWNSIWTHKKHLNSRYFRGSFRRSNPFACVVNGVRWATEKSYKYYGCQFESKTVTLTCPEVQDRQEDHLLSALVANDRSRKNLPELPHDQSALRHRDVARHPWR
jgi:hypothetical protein